MVAEQCLFVSSFIAIQRKPWRKIDINFVMSIASENLASSLRVQTLNILLTFFACFLTKNQTSGEKPQTLHKKARHQVEHLLFNRYQPDER